MWRQPPIWEPQGHEVPAVQHHDPDLFLYRKVLRPFVWPASSLIVVEHQKVHEHVVEKEKPV